MVSNSNSTNSDSELVVRGRDGRERLIYAAAIEALLVHGQHGKLSPETLAELSQMGIDLSKPLKPAYSYGLWKKVLELIAQRIYAEVDRSQAYFNIGESLVMGMENTLVGRAMVAMARLVGPRRALLRIPHNSRGNASHSDIIATEVRSNCIDIVVEEYDLPAEFMQGSLHAAATISGAKTLKVEVLQHDEVAEHVHYRVSWKA
jgi:uncharacterized protein (TIGR02265 family)